MLYIVYCILYIVYCILYIVYCILYIIYYILYIIYYVLCIIYHILYIRHYILYSIYYILYLILDYNILACSCRFHRQDVLWKSSAVATGSCFVTSIVAFLQQGAALLLQLLYSCKCFKLLLSCNRELLCYFDCCFVASALSCQVESKNSPRSSKLSPQGGLGAPS